MTEHTELITETMVLPTGCTTDEYDYPSFAVYVRWVGNGWAVTTTFRDHRLSRAGNWCYYVPRFKRHQYRWETREEALEWAHKVVDEHTVNGRTYIEWQEWKRVREQERSQAAGQGRGSAEPGAAGDDLGGDGADGSRQGARPTSGESEGARL